MKKTAMTILCLLVRNRIRLYKVFNDRHVVYLYHDLDINSHLSRLSTNLVYDLNGLHRYIDYNIYFLFLR
jgi:hypothetical protein